jgi:hypothetical protein
MLSQWMLLALFCVFLFAFFNLHVRFLLFLDTHITQDLFNAEDLRTGHGRFGATAGSNQLSRSSTHSSSGSGVGMEKQETVAIRSALDVQRTALDRLSDVLKRDMRDLGIVKREAGLRIGN